MTTEDRARRERARRRAELRATAAAHSRALRLKNRFRYLTDTELAAFETDCQRSYMAGFTRAACDPDAWDIDAMLRKLP